MLTCAVLSAHARRHHRYPHSHAQEIRNEKAKEAAPFHTIDYRSTDVRELPHKMRALFEDNQVGQQAY